MMAVEQIDPVLRKYVYRQLGVAAKDREQRVKAAPFLALAGAAGRPGAADHILPKYDDPRQFAVWKLEAQQKILKAFNEANKARLQGAASLASAMGKDNPYIKALDLFLDAANADAKVKASVLGNWNNNFTDLVVSRIRAKASGSTSGVSAGGVRNFLESMYDSATGQFLHDEAVIEQLVKEIEVQTGIVANSSNPKQAAEAQETLDVAIGAADSILQATGRGGLQDLIDGNPGAPGKDRLQDAWDQSQNNPTASQFSSEIALEVSQDAANAAGELIKTAPSGMEKGLEAFVEWAPKLGLVADDGKFASESFAAHLEKLAPESDTKLNATSVSDAFEQLHTMEPNLGPSSLKARFFDQKTPEGERLEKLRQKLGFKTQQATWTYLRKILSEAKMKEANEDNTRMAQLLQGGITPDSGPPAAAEPAAPAEKSEALAPSDGGTDGGPRFFNDGQKIWKLSGDQLTEATEDELDVLDEMLKDAPELLEDMDQFRRARVMLKARETAIAAQPGGMVDKAETKRTAEAEAAEPDRGPALPRIGNAVRSAVYYGTHPTMAANRIAGALRSKLRPSGVDQAPPPPKVDGPGDGVAPNKDTPLEQAMVNTYSAEIPRGLKPFDPKLPATGGPRGGRIDLGEEVYLKWLESQDPDWVDQWFERIREGQGSAP